MKGLLIKDFKLMKAQKNFFLMISIAIGMTALSNDLFFMLGLLTYVISLFTLSTISYDEFDNGYAFLFILPVSRKEYVFEKYCLALLLGGVAWIFGTILGFTIWKTIIPIPDIVMRCGMILFAMLMIQAVMIPVQLKFGGEKGRIVLIGVVGVLFAVVIGVGKVVEDSTVVFDIVYNFPTLSAVMWTVIMFVVAVAAWLASMGISILIMNRKEF